MNAKETLKQFLNEWKAGSAEAVHALTTKTWQSTHKADELAATQPPTYRIMKMTVKGVICDFALKLNNENHTCRLVKESAPYKGDANGVWGVNPISFKLVK